MRREVGIKPPRPQALLMLEHSRQERSMTSHVLTSKMVHQINHRMLGHTSHFSTQCYRDNRIDIKRPHSEQWKNIMCDPGAMPSM